MPDPGQLKQASGSGDPSEERRMSETRLTRIGRVRKRLSELEVDAILLSIGTDMPWCTGYEAMPSERPTVLVIPRDEDATLVIPELEAPRVRQDPQLFSLRPWGERDDAIEVVASLLGPRLRIAISDRTWASVVIGLQRSLPDATLRRGSEVMAPLREIKDDAEIAALRAAGKAADAVSAALLGGAIALIGRTERDVSREIADRLIAAGHSRVGNPIVASGPNSASPHHTAGDRMISAGEPVVCDFGGSLALGSGGEYWSDTTRTVCTGTPSEELKEVYEVVREANQQALSAVYVGAPCQEIDRAARGVIEAAGYGQFFIHRTGHGIGMDGHEDPYIIEGNTSPLQAGNAFSIEPGIYLPGRMGVRIEDIVLLDGEEIVRCNDADRTLHIVEA